ncbi:MAG: transporter substrate-binding domain-containing protein [Eudoraea sp.]|uniref:transporter substrate-binding domain-containing protein n=1 Tax=Eudoraea sp. TaxID=1979955 RepID=UPI003C741B14
MKLKYAALIMLFFVALTLPVNAQKTLAKIVKNGEIRIGLSGNQPPYSMKSKTGDLMGLEVDLAKALASGMGVELNMVVLPFSELLPALKAGEVDAVMSGMTVTTNRSIDALFAGPYTVSGKSILAKGSVLSNMKGTEEANNEAYKISFLKGSTSETFVKKYMPKAQAMPVNNYDEGIAMILNDKADAMVADYSICVITIMRNQGKDLVTLESPLNIEPIGMALPAGDLHFLNLVENYLQAFDMAGALELLDQKWLKDGNWLFSME